jgi:O-glycosyl hydrolase
MKKLKIFILPLLASVLALNSCNNNPLNDEVTDSNPKVASKVETGGSINVNICCQKQKIDLMGAGCYFYSGHILSVNNLDDASKWMWSDLNVNVFKIVLRNGGVEDVNDNTNPNVTDFTKFNFAANSNNVDQITAAKRAIALNPNMKIWAIVLSPPKFLKTNNNVNNGGTLKTTVRNAYAEFGESTYAHLKNLKDNGITVSFLSLMNEPDFVSTDIPYESADFSIPIAKNVYTTTANWIKTKLTGTNISIPKFASPDCISVSNATAYINELEKTGNMGFYTTHQYSNSSAANFTTASTAAGAKGLYMAEWHAGFGLGATPDELTSSLDLINKFHDAFRGGSKGWLYFEWGNPQPNFGGLLFTPFNGQASRKKNYYTFKQYTDDILDSNYTPTVLSGIINFGADNVTAFSKSNSAAVNVVNWNGSAQNRVRLNFGGNIKTIKVYRTSATENNALVWSQDNVNLNYYDVDFSALSFTTVRVTW